MNLYHWKSERFAEYLDGDIIAVGETIPEARRNAWMRYEADYGSDTHEERRKFRADIMQRPRVVKFGAFMVRGSA